MGVIILSVYIAVVCVLKKGFARAANDFLLLTLIPWEQKPDLPTILTIPLPTLTVCLLRLQISHLWQCCFSVISLHLISLNCFSCLHFVLIAMSYFLQSKCQLGYLNNNNNNNNNNNKLTNSMASAILTFNASFTRALQ